MMNTVLVPLNQLLALARENPFVTLVLFVVLLQLVKRSKHVFQVVGNWLGSTRTTTNSSTTLSYQELSSSPSSNNTNNNQQTRRPVVSNDLQRVRELQQERANELAQRAAEERKKKAEEERKRKNSVAQLNPNHKTGGGRTLGGSSSHSPRSSTTDRGGYNPMQPWTAGTSGYRPQRRTVSRG